MEVAITVARPGQATRGPLINRSAGDWSALLVRILLVTYLGLVVALHVATVPTIFEIKQSTCEPGSCFPGQVTADTATWLDNRGISLMTYAIIATAIPLLIPIAGHLLAGVTIWQRPTTWLPTLFVIGLAVCTLSASGATWVLYMENPTWKQPLLGVAVITLLTGALMVLLFPTGRFVPAWSVLLLPMIAIETVNLVRPDWFLTAPAAVQRLLDLWITYSEFVAVAIIAWRLHVTTDRLAFRQTRVWFIAQIPMWISVAVFLLFPIRDEDTIWASGDLWSIIHMFIWAFTILFFLGGMLIAIYLYNIYDLSIVVRRSLVYGLLSVLLIGIYLVTVATVSVVLGGGDSAAPALLATIVIALGFAPLRDWLQNLVRRLLYGDEADPYGVLSRFGRQLEETSAPERLLRSVVELAQDTLRVPGVALAVDGAPNLGVETGSASSAPTLIPVRYQGEQVGTMTVTPRSPGESFSPADHRLIDEIARQMGIAVHSILLSEDLRHSRERIVTAREEERRRIRRDLHDGLGPSLAALSLQVEIARDLIATDPHRSSELLDDVLGQTRESILDIRRLVYELRPPALDDLGLLGAIQAQAMTWARSGLAVTLDLDDDLPLGSAATEVAIYRIVQEAMTNVLRHAEATAVAIRLTASDGSIRVEIVDDGRGMPISTQPGVGLVSMRERAAELGGTCEVSANPTGGTRVVATFRSVEPRDG